MKLSYLFLFDRASMMHMEIEIDLLGKTVDDVVDYLVDELDFEASDVAELKRMSYSSLRAIFSKK